VVLGTPNDNQQSGKSDDEDTESTSPESFFPQYTFVAGFPGYFDMLRIINFANDQPTGSWLG
jgi:hypothetical protein